MQVGSLMLTPSSPVVGSLSRTSSSKSRSNPPTTTTPMCNGGGSSSNRHFRDLNLSLAPPSDRDVTSKRHHAHHDVMLTDFCRLLKQMPPAVPPGLLRPQTTQGGVRRESINKVLH